MGKISEPDYKKMLTDMVQLAPSPEQLELLIQWIDEFDLIAGKRSREVQEMLEQFKIGLIVLHELLEIE